MKKMMMIIFLLVLSFRFGVCDDSSSIAAAGRPFRLGDFYNRPSDELILGKTFWGLTKLQDTVSKNNYRTKLSLMEGDHEADKLNHFGIDVQLSCSFMEGKIEISGACSYVADNKRKESTSRVSYSYAADTRFETLKPEYLVEKNFDCLDITDCIKTAKDQKRATHVVIGIEYGAGAVFLFEKDYKEENMGNNLNGKVNIKIDLDVVKISASAEFQIQNNQTKKDSSIKCKFYGDFLIEKPPTDIASAQALYPQLYSLMKGGGDFENVVPQRVYLLDFQYIESSALYELLKDCIQTVLKKVKKIKQELIESKQVITEVMELAVIQYHTRIKLETAIFIDCVERYEAYWASRMAEILPKLIRQKAITASAPLKEMMELLKEKEQGPYGYASMLFWTTEKVEESTLLKAGHHYLPNRAANAGAFSGTLNNAELRYTIALTFRVAKRTDEYVHGKLLKYWEKMDEIAQDSKANMFDLKDFTYAGVPVSQRWWEADHTAQQALASKAKDISAWSNITLARKKLGFDVKIQFGTREAFLPMCESMPNVKSELFSDGSLKTPDFDIPSSSGRPLFHNASHDYIVIKWEKPERGVSNLKYYEILILQDEKNFDDDEPLWKPTKKKDMPHEQGLYGVLKRFYLPPKGNNKTRDFLSTRITNLPADVNLFFQVSVYSKYGMTAKSEISFMMKTTKCSPGYMHEGEDGEKYHKCKQCQPGHASNYFGHKTGSDCPKCHQGFFQPLPGQKYCRPCSNAAVPAGSAYCQCPIPSTLPKTCSTISCIITKLSTYFSAKCAEERRKHMNQLAMLL